MIVVLPFFSGDAPLALSLLEWIKQLGKHPQHSCLLVVDADTDWGTALDALNLANEIFRTATLITNDKPVTGWIPGSNSLFAAAAKHMEGIGEPWLWLEPDAAPLRSGWLDSIVAAYGACGKPFMGSLVHHSLTNRPNPYLEGCGVYPSDTWSRIKDKFIMEESWTLWCADEVVPHAVNSPLFQHFWGVQDLPATFVDVKTPSSPINAFTLRDVSSEAVLYHRCKDGSIIRLLRQKLFPVEQNRFVVVLPFCAKDCASMFKLLEWMERMGHYPLDTVLLAHDNCPGVAACRKVAAECFGQVIDFVYPPPVRIEHPYAANHIFKFVAHYIQTKVKRPWLWFEADMVPLKRGWLDTLQAAYRAGGKPFFGSVVPGMGHFNGTAIYPSNTYERCDGLRFKDGEAFDTAILPHTKNQTMDGTALMAHAWVQENGKLLPHGAGELPVFRTVADVKRIHPSAVTFHRDKTLSLIDRLTEMRVA